jgi:two-component system nitrate/nitrite sensor histidine kinase NarX
MVQVRLGELQGGLKRAYTQVRMALTGLRQPAPDSSQLVAAVEALLAEFSEQNGASVDLAVAGADIDCLSPLMQKQLLYIVREALTNIGRHAQATCVQLSLTRENGLARVTIADDGTGFDPAAVDDQKHLGLAIMRARAERSQGHLSIHSQPGQGTRITVSFPAQQRGKQTQQPLRSV